MSFVVSKSPMVVVRPSELLVTTDNISLSPYDKVARGLPTVLLLFENPIHEPAETIRSGLSKALVHYHPIAGRLAQGADDGEVEIACTGEGVSFVAASANCALKDLVFSDCLPVITTATLLNELAIYYPAEGCGRTDPLLLMQVTQFSCGGFVVGVGWNHVIADGAGIAQFLQAVGDLARGLPSPAVAPVRCDDKLVGLPTPNLHYFRQLAGSLPNFELAALDITIPRSAINRIKHEFCDGKPCTVFEAAMAVLWQCHTRATMSNPEAPTAFMFTANARKHIGAKAGYYGNCVTVQLVMSDSGAVANGDVMDVVKMIRRAKERVNYEDGGVLDMAKMVQCAKDDAPQQFSKEVRDSSLQQFAALVLGYNHFLATSWQNLGLEDADFGGGRPSRVMYYAQNRVGTPMCVPLPSCKGSNGYNVLSIFVKEQHVDAFLGELAKFT